MNDAPPWRLFVLGGFRLVAPDGRDVAVGGKQLAALTYLAVEETAPRARVVTLLWPDRTEAAARNNFAQLARRMRAAFGEDLVIGQDTLSLAPSVEVDVRRVLRDDASDSDVPGGQLLEGVALDDSLDFTDWLAVQRERVDTRRTRSSARAAARAEERGDFALAAHHARRALDFDPLSEDAHRRLMRLLYLQGRPRLALEVYARLRSVLGDELHTRPMPETLDLVRIIERGEALPAANAPRAASRFAVRSPRLVGRDAEWARMEEGWRAGQFIIVGGEPGMGKTRLVTDFAASKGRALIVEARPGDALVPYATTTRSLRRALHASPIEVPLDARRTLSFLLPELAPPGEPPSDVTDAALRRALQSTLALVLTTVDVCVFDDMQFADEASVDVGFEFIDAFFPMGGASGVPPFIAVHRENALPDFTRRIFERLEQAGRAAWLHLAPLSERGARELLEDLGVERTDGLAEASNGHPLFLLESVKALALGRELDASPTVPPKLGQLIRDRLATLSKTALHVARASAVLRRDFTPDLVADALSAPLLEVAGAWDELEEAQVLTSERFHHDLVAEAVLEGIPASVRRLLHRGAARALIAHGAPPARVAWHWREGGQDLEAAPWLLRAGEWARKSLRLRDAAAQFEAAARIFEAHEDARAFEAWFKRAEALALTDDVSVRQASVNDVLERATLPAEVAHGWLLQAALFAATNEGARAETAARRGLDALGDEDAPALRANLLGDLGVALWTQGRLKDAEEAVRAALTLLEPLGPSSALAEGLSNLAVLLDHQDRHRDAEPVHLRAVDTLERLGDQSLLVVILCNLAVCLGELGDGRGAVAALRRAAALHEANAGEGSAMLRVSLGTSYADVHEYASALASFEHVLRHDHDPSGWLHDYVRALLANVLVALGSFERAEALLTRALASTIPDAFLARVHLVCARLRLARGEDSSADLARGEALLGAAPRPLSLGRLRLVAAAAGSLDAARDALALGEAHDLPGLQLSAHASLAFLLARRGSPDEALTHGRRAAHLLERYEPADLSRAEVLLAVFEARRAAGDAEADAAWQAARAWFEERLERHVPPELRADFTARGVFARHPSSAVTT